LNDRLSGWWGAGCGACFTVVILTQQGGSLEVVYLEGNERLAACTFCCTSSHLEPGAEITALLPFSTDRNHATR
jgi:hypothetical protein